MTPNTKLPRLTLLFALAAGCATGPGPSAGSRHGPAVREMPGEGTDQLETFAVYEHKLLQHRRDRTRLAAEVVADEDRCEDLYALTQSICEVRDKLCDLADDHRTMPEYVALCREAQRECNDAVDSCERCQPAR